MRINGNELKNGVLEGNQAHLRTVKTTNDLLKNKRSTIKIFSIQELKKNDEFIHNSFRRVS